MNDTVVVVHHLQTKLKENNETISKKKKQMHNRTDVSKLN